MDFKTILSNWLNCNPNDDQECERVGIALWDYIEYELETADPEVYAILYSILEPGEDEFEDEFAAMELIMEFINNR